MTWRSSHNLLFDYSTVTDRRSPCLWGGGGSLALLIKPPLYKLICDVMKTAVGRWAPFFYLPWLYFCPPLSSYIFQLLILSFYFPPPLFPPPKKKNSSLFHLTCSLSTELYAVRAQHKVWWQCTAKLEVRWCLSFQSLMCQERPQLGPYGGFEVRGTNRDE